MYRLTPRPLSYSHRYLQLFPFDLKLKDLIIGQATYIIDSNNQMLSIQWFCIKPDYQGLGYGRQFYRLLENYIDHSHQQKIINLDATESAYSFWLKMGYRLEKSKLLKDLHASDGLDLLPMIKSI